MTSSTSSPTEIVPGRTMSARRPARWTMPLRTPGRVMLWMWLHGSHHSAPTASSAHPEALVQQVVQLHAGGEHLPADLGVAQRDAGLLRERLERLRLDERDVAAAEMTITREALAAHFDRVDRLGELLVLGGDSDRFDSSRHVAPE